MHILTPYTPLLLVAARRPTLLRNGGTDGWVESVGTGKGPCGRNSAPRSSPLHLHQDCSLAEKESCLEGLLPCLSATVQTAVMASTQPCMCACTCARPRAASGTCSQQPRGGAPPTWYQVGVGVTVQLVPRGPPLPPSVVRSSGKIKGVVTWKVECACWSLSCAYCRQCEGGPALQAPQEEEGAVFSSSP